VQRVPVRIAIDAKDLAEHPLRVGLSMDVTVNTEDGSGKSLADVPRTSPAASTAVFDVQQEAADQRVERIITANLGRTAAAR
jgi:membrane fusion protein (multidrug efflux system)